MSLPLGFKHAVAKHAKKRYRGTRASTVSGLTTVLLRRELKSRQRLPITAIGFW